MLQNSRYWISLIFGFFLWSSKAPAVLLLAPGASESQFQSYALANNQQTYTQWFQQKINDPEQEAHPQVLKFSQEALKKGASAEILKRWTLLRQNLQLTPMDREVLILLAEKLKIQKELCRYFLLDEELGQILENPSQATSCLFKMSLEKLAVPADSRLWVIEGKAFTADQLPPKILKDDYQWRLVSDSQEDRKFFGSFSALKKQNFSERPHVLGTANSYRIESLDAQTVAQSQIFFEDGKVRPAIAPPMTFSRWVSEHKVLVWGLGIVAAGFAAHQLKDKTLVITR